MAAKDLITTARAKDALGGTQGSANLTLSADEQTTLADQITSVSNAIERYCRRRFLTQAYDEVYNGNADRRLLLRQYPIQKVDSVRYRPVTVLKIINQTPANVQARVSVLSTGLQLTTVNAGAKTVVTAGLTFAGNPTLTALANAVNGIGSGWVATPSGDNVNYGGWPSADLYIPASYGDPLEGAGVQTSQGNLTAAGQNAELKMHTYELAGYQWDARGWLLRAIPYTDPELLHPEDLVWPLGINNFRIQYTAGYTVVPEDIQEACAQWVAMLFWQTKRDPALMHQVPSSGSTQGWRQNTGRYPSHPPDTVRTLLAPHVRRTVHHDQG